MTSYGQFCSMARAHEALGGRWSLLIVREMLCGARRFNDIRRGIPRISRTVLAERLRELVAASVAVRTEGPAGPEYELTEAGRDLAPVVAAMAAWGQRWLPREAGAEDNDLSPVLVDMARRLSSDNAPREPLVIRFEIAGERRPSFLYLARGEASVCDHNPGFPEPLTVRGPLAALVAWWRGDAAFDEARRRGLVVEGPRPLVRAFPGWFARYLFADIPPAS